MERARAYARRGRRGKEKDDNHQDLAAHVCGYKSNKMTMREKHELRVRVNRQWRSESHIALSIVKQDVAILLMFCALLARTIQLKRISILVVQLEGKEKNDLPPSLSLSASIPVTLARPPARPSINAYTRLIIICVSSNPLSFAARFHALSLVLPLRTLIVPRR